MGTLAQRLLGNSAVYGVSRVAYNAIGFLLIPVYARYLGDAGYGVVATLQTVAFILHIALSQGLHESWSRLGVHYSGEDRRVFESAIVWYLALSCCALVGALMLAGPWLATIVTPGIPFFPLGALAVVGAVLLIPGMFFQRKMQVEERPRAFAFYAFARIVLIPGSVVLFVVGLRRGVEGKLEADIVSGVLLSAIALVWIRPRLPSRAALPKLREALVYGLPLLPHSIAWFVNSLLDRLLVNGFLGLAATGVYSMGYKIASTSEVLSGVMALALVPVFASTLKDLDEQQHLEPQERERRLEALSRLVLLIVVTAAGAALITSALAREALWLLTTPQFHTAWQVVPLVSFAVVVLACYRAFETELLHERRGPRHLAVVSIVGALVNVGANLILLPWFGIVGAAAASVVSNAALAGGVLVLRNRHARVRHAWSLWGAVLVITALGLAAIWMSDALVTSDLERIGAKLIAATVAGLLILRVSRFKVGDLVRMLRNALHRRIRGDA